MGLGRRRAEKRVSRSRGLGRKSGFGGSPAPPAASLQERLPGTKAFLPFCHPAPLAPARPGPAGQSSATGRPLPWTRAVAHALVTSVRFRLSRASWNPEVSGGVAALGAVLR